MRRRTDRLVVACTALCIICTVVVALVVTPTFLDNRRTTGQVRALTLQTHHDAGVTTAALCALRADLQRRVTSSRAFLAAHPNGLAEIPATTIRDGVANEQRTIAALSDIDCRTR